MPVDPLKRAEQAIERIREQAEWRPETAIALQIFEQRFKFGVFLFTHGRPHVQSVRVVV